MRVFISWSGELSRQLAEALHRWLQNVLQFVKPYFTLSDIEKGARWANEISKELEKSTFGIIALTRDNLHEPWINFEAGAISSSVEQGRVCPIVFDMKPTDVDGPLAQFQSSRFTREDIHHLIRTINNAAAEDKKLSESRVDSAFDMWWPKLEAEINTILRNAVLPHSPQQVRSDRELMEEMLSLIRGISSRQEQLEAANRNRDSMVAALQRLYTPFLRPTLLGGDTGIPGGSGAAPLPLTIPRSVDEVRSAKSAVDQATSKPTTEDQESGKR